MKKFFSSLIIIAVMALVAISGAMVVAAALTSDTSNVRFAVGFFEKEKGAIAAAMAPPTARHVLFAAATILPSIGIGMAQ